MMNEDLTPGIKRSSDELIQTDDVSTDTMMSAEENHVTNNNDAKKVKLDSRNEPSKVIHIGNIPDDITEAEIIQLGTPFGKVTQILVLKGKNQAFLELSDESAATAMVNYFSSSTAQLRGRVVYVQFSNHKELKTDRTSNANQSNAPPLLQSSHPLVSESDTQGGPSSVLRIVVKHMIYPVTLDVLHQIFSKVGKVMKIVTFTKNNTFQALIQYPDAVAAQAAKMTMDGQNVYNDCCTLRIEYSKSNNLNVKYNNDKSRDYTNHTLPTGDAALDSALAVGGMPFTGMPLAGINPAAVAYGTARMHMPGQTLSCVLHVSNLNEEMVTPDALFTLFGVYGDVHRVKILYNKKDNALIQMSEPQQTQLALSYLNKLRLWGKSIRVALSKHRYVQLPKEGQPDAGLSKDYSNSSLHRFKKPGSKNYQNIYPPSSTLHLSNIPPTITEEEIRDAFEKAGCLVIAFKFFPSKERKMALIQLESNEEAVLALIKMHNYQLGDSSHLRVSFSKSTI